MGCTCRKAGTAKEYVWTSADGSEKATYRTEVEARAAVIRKGGSYQPK